MQTDLTKMNCEIPTLTRQTNQIGEREAYLDLGHDACVVAPCSDCLIACEMNLTLIKDGTWPMVEEVKAERIAHFEALIAAGKAVSSCTGNTRFVCHAKKRRMRLSVE